MNRSLPRAIVDLLSLTQDGPAISPGWRAFNQLKWEQTLDGMDLAGLALYFRQRVMADGGMETLPESVRSRLDQCAAGNRLRAADAAEELRKLTQSFTSAGIRYAVLKGFALVPDYCPEPELRTQYDHDILVHPSSFNRVEEILNDAGYRRKNARSEAISVYRRPEPEIRFSRLAEALYSPNLGRSIEVHLTLWEESEDMIQIDLPGDFLNRAVPRRWGGLEYVALCDEDCLLFQILHAFRHILRNWARMSMFLEIAYFLKHRASDLDFWNRFGDRISNVRWAREASLVVLGLSGRLFNSAIPKQVEARLATPLSPILRLWIERYGQHSALTNFRGDKCSLFLHGEFVEDLSSWTRIRRKRLLPIRRPHRPPPIVFQRGFSYREKLWMESVHAFNRLKFHATTGLQYAWEYPQWMFLRHVQQRTG